MKRLATIPLSWLLALLPIAGCTATPEIGNDLDVRTKHAIDDAGALSRGDLFDARNATFRVTRGDLSGKTMRLDVARNADRGTITRTLDDGTILSELRFEFEGQRVFERGFRNHERDVTVQLRPDQRLWPIDGRTQTMDIRIVKLSDPNTVKERGEAKSTMTVESLDTVTTPAGVYDAVRVRTVFESGLRAAKAKRITERWYAPGEGLIAERFDETVTALGIPIERTSRTIVRTP